MFSSQQPVFYSLRLRSLKPIFKIFIYSSRLQAVLDSIPKFFVALDGYIPYPFIVSIQISET